MQRTRKPDVLKIELADLKQSKSKTEENLKDTRLIAEMMKQPGWKIYLNMIQENFEEVEKELDKHETFDNEKRIRILQQRADMRFILNIKEVAGAKTEQMQEKIQYLTTQITKKKGRLKLYGAN